MVERLAEDKVKGVCGHQVGLGAKYLQILCLYLCEGDDGVGALVLDGLNVVLLWGALNLVANVLFCVVDPGVGGGTGGDGKQ